MQTATVEKHSVATQFPPLFDHCYTKTCDKQAVMCDKGCQYDLEYYEMESNQILLERMVTSSPIPFLNAEPIAEFNEVDEESYITSQNQTDPSYKPNETNYSDSLEFSASDSMITAPLSYDIDRTYLIYGNQLNLLFKFCPTCGSPIVDLHKLYCGSLIGVQYNCLNNCASTWYSQPLIRNIPLGNLMVAGATLFTGNQFDKLLSFAEVLKLSFISDTTYYKIQETYLFPVINELYNQQQVALITAFADEPVFLCGDGQCDSPGHSAKYLTYTLMEEETRAIVSSYIVSVDKVCNSNAMELEGFKQALNILEDYHMHIIGVATDRHVQIASFMKTDRPDLIHQYDVFHVAKSVTKKLTKAGQKRNCEQLLPWMQSISNHLWWCCSTCHGDEVVNVIVEV